MQTHLVKVKHEVQLADILKRSVERFYKNLSGKLEHSGNLIDITADLYQVQNPKLALRPIHHEHKIECCIVAINYPPSFIRVVFGA